jgi:hypothetical protein
MDREATRDSSGARVVGIVLGVLLLFGVVVFFAQGGSSLLGQAGPEVLVFFLLLVGLMVGGVLTIVHGSKRPAGAAVSGILGGLAFGVGGVLLGVLIFCLVILAAFQNFIESCSRCGR